MSDEFVMQRPSIITFLLALGWDERRISKAVGKPMSYLRQHHRNEMLGAPDIVEAALIGALGEKALNGDMQSIRMLMALLADGRVKSAKQFARYAKMGKKEIAKIEAEAAFSDDDGWGSLIAGPSH